MRTLPRTILARATAWILAVLLAMPLPALAGESKNEGADSATAKTLAASAAKLARTGRYEQALTLYRQAYVLDPAPVLLFNIAVLTEKSGALFDAVAAYERYIDAEKTPGAVDDAKLRLAAVLRRAPARLIVEGAPIGARVFVDDRAIGVLPRVEAELRPGTHSIRVVADGHTAQAKALELSAGRSQQWDVTLAAVSPPTVLRRPTPAPAPSPMETPDVNPDDEDDNTTMWVLIGVGSALLVGGAIALGVIYGRPDRTVAAPPPDRTWNLGGVR